MNKTRVILLTASFGKGHNIIAKNLKEEINKNLNIDCEIVDYMKLYGKNIELIATSIYNLTREFLPTLYDIRYKYLTDLKTRNLFDRMALRAIKKKLKGDITNTIFISLFPNATVGLSNIKCKAKYTITTDYGEIHKEWFNKNIDGYFVATLKIKNKLLEYGFSENKIYVTGIPIGKEFYNKKKRRHMKNIDPLKKTILMMGGGDGVFNSPIKILKRLSVHYNIIFIAGSNKVLKDKVEKLKINNVITIGYTNRIKNYIDQSDVVISKAGGISLTEFAVSKIPIVLYKKTTGQEKGNINYFIENNACVLVDDLEDLDRTIYDIFNNKIKVNTNLIDTKTPAIDKIIDIIRKQL
jgi:processive 1,2-diacylglycerol beta-glucosyltransferase